MKKPFKKNHRILSALLIVSTLLIGAVLSNLQSTGQSKTANRAFAQTAQGEFPINTYTTSHQFQSDVAMHSNGNFVVTWTSDGQDGDVYGIYAQMYNASGTPVSSEFQVNTYTAGNQFPSRIAMDSNGNFVITWASDGQDGSGYGIYAQMYNATGTPIGSEFQVNTYTTDNQFPSAIAMDTNGNFVIAWHSNDQDGSDNGIFAQKYDASGNTVGSEFQVNTTTANAQNNPVIAMDPNGNFVIAWQSDGQDGDAWGIYAQRYNASGNTVGSEFQVNTTTTDSQFSSDIAMDSSGNFVITWQSGILGDIDYEVYAQLYNATGTPVGSEFLVNTYTTGRQFQSNVAMHPSGNFVIAWASNGGQDGSDNGIYAQKYDATGTPVGSEFQVNTYTTLSQRLPAIATDSGGGFIIIWESHSQDGDGYGIYAQMYYDVVCGNGIIRDSETCDDGNTTAGDGCSSVCQLESGLVAFGSNTDGRLGIGTLTGESTVPVDTNGFSANAVGAGAGEHSCILTGAGGVKCWGTNDEGQMGDGTTVSKGDPTDVTGLTSGVTQIAMGRLHSCALLDDGTVRCWGSNQYGRLGDGNGDGLATTISNVPVVVCDVGETAPCSTFLSGVSSISAGTNHTCAVMTDDTATCWGFNIRGQIGDGTQSFVTFALVPKVVVGLTGVQDIAAGGVHTCALKTTGEVQCWGSNSNGQLGDDQNCSTSFCTSPVTVCATGDTAPCSSFLSGVTAITTGSGTSCAVQSGAAKCWGFNDRGQLGIGNKTQRLTPVQVTGLTSGVTDISTGQLGHTCAVVNGAAKCWGFNVKGELGNGMDIDNFDDHADSIADNCSAFDACESPVDVTGLSSGVNTIVAGYTHTLAMVDGPDGDSDLIADRFDNCPAVQNADQLDTSDDGVGDACTVGRSRPRVCEPIATSLSGFNTSLIQQNGNAAVSLSWNSDNPDPNETIIVYRGLGDVDDTDRMMGLAQLSTTETSFINEFTNSYDYQNTYTYAIRTFNNCGNSSDPIFSNSIYIPKRIEEGQPINLKLNILVKVKQVRENLLFERIQQVVEDQADPEISLTESALISTFEATNTDAASLVNYDQIANNETLKEAILAIEDIETLIKGHSETLTLEVWEPGNRVSPVLSQPIETNIFGEAELTLPDFIVGTYDFTIKLPNAIRHSLSSITANVSPLLLDFTYSTLRFGDFNNDNIIDLEDIRHLSTGFNVTPELYDINEDGVFDLMDIMEVLTNWGSE